MTLWIRSRRIPHLAGTLVVVGILQALLSQRVISFPVLVGHVGVAFWSMFLPVIVGVAVANSIASKTQSIEARVAGRVLLLDVALLAGISVAAAAVLAALGGTHPHVIGTAGQVMIGVGVAASVTLWWGLAAGVLAPLAVAIVCVAYGRDAPGGRYVRILAPDSSGWWDFLLGGALLTLALTLILTRTVRVGFRLADVLAD